MFKTLKVYFIILKKVLFYLWTLFCKKLESVECKKGADQPAHPHSLISSFVICLLESIISLVPNSVTTIFGFSLIGRRETIRKTERR